MSISPIELNGSVAGGSYRNDQMVNAGVSEDVSSRSLVMNAAWSSAVLAHPRIDDAAGQPSSLNAIGLLVCVVNSA